MFFVEPCLTTFAIARKLLLIEDPAATPGSTDKVLRRAGEGTRGTRSSRQVDRPPATLLVLAGLFRQRRSAERDHIRVRRHPQAIEAPPSCRSRRPAARELPHAQPVLRLADPAGATPSAQAP